MRLTPPAANNTRARLRGECYAIFTVLQSCEGRHAWAAMRSGEDSRLCSIAYKTPAAQHVCAYKTGAVRTWSRRRRGGEQELVQWQLFYVPRSLCDQPTLIPTCRSRRCHTRISAPLLCVPLFPACDLVQLGAGTGACRSRSGWSLMCFPRPSACVTGPGLSSLPMAT